MWANTGKPSRRRSRLRDPVSCSSYRRKTKILHKHSTLFATWRVVLRGGRKRPNRAAAFWASTATEKTGKDIYHGDPQHSRLARAEYLDQVYGIGTRRRSRGNQISRTGWIVRAATVRGIPTRRLNDGSIVQFGWGSKQHRILAAETDRTSAIGESIAQDKELTKNLLKSVGVPVPEGRPVKDAEQAWAVACDIGLPVVVKPQYGNQGRGVAVNLTTREQVAAAFDAPRAEASSIMVANFAPGC